MGLPELPLERRVMGIETEFGITITPANGTNLWLAESKILSALLYFQTGRNTRDIFLSNGARYYNDNIYSDSGSSYKLEYSTPEADNAIEAVAHDKAGERIVAANSVKLEKYLRKEHGTEVKINLYKNNSDTKDNTWGSHQNYQMARHHWRDNTDAPKLEEIYQLLMSFFVSRIIFTGAGKVLYQAGRNFAMGNYVIMDRARFILEDISAATTQCRGIINTKDEPLADRSRFIRLHHIMDDSNMSEFSDYLKIGTGAIAVHLVEAGVFPIFELANPVQVLHQISEDLTLKREYDVNINGATKKMTAIQMQKEYHLAALSYFGRNPPADSSAMQVIRDWGETLDALENEPMSLHRELDWVIKLNILLKRMERKNLPLAEASQICTEYHNVNPARGIYYRLLSQSEGLRPRRICTDDQIENAMTNPPNNTRAYRRGSYAIDFITESNPEYTVLSVGWSGVSTKTANGDRYLYSADPREVEFS